MKTIADAHRELEGDLSNTYCFDDNNNHTLYFHVPTDVYVTFGKNVKVSTDHVKICTVEEFNNYKGDGMKTVMDAVNEFKSVWPDCRVGCLHYSNRLGSWAPSVHTYMNHGYQLVCISEQFNTLVQECMTNFGSSVTYDEYKADYGSIQLKDEMAKEGKVDYTSEEFWEDAPEGATLWDPQCHVWCDDNGYWPEGSYSYRKAAQAGLGTGRYIHRPKPQPIFTKAMQDAGELPCIGMEVSFDRMIVTIVGYTLKGMPVFEMPSGMVDSFNSNNSYRPIDTRTDKEKAIDEFVDIFLPEDKAISRAALSLAYDKWVGK